MKTNLTTSIIVTLVLSHEEAHWLHMVMQNPIYGNRPENEEPRDKEMRKAFWDATLPAVH